jgi:hypothetical protein
MTSFRVPAGPIRAHIGIDGSRSGRGDAHAIINPAGVFATVVIMDAIKAFD